MLPLKFANSTPQTAVPHLFSDAVISPIGIKKSNRAKSELNIFMPILSKSPKVIKVSDRDIAITESDINKLKPVIFGEISNRAKDKLELEARVVLNTALNRMSEYNAKGKSKTLSEVLAMPNQYQAYGGEQFNKYKKSANILDARKREIVNNIVDNLMREIERGAFKDNTQGATHYYHDKLGRIFYDTSKKLFK